MLLEWVWKGKNARRKGSFLLASGFCIIDYVTGDTQAEHLLSLEGCELIEKHATVDAHNVPVITDGAAELFN